MISNRDLVAWHCRNCGRSEASRNEKYCLKCGSKKQRCSRYEWFLSDNLRFVLRAMEARFKLIEQYRVPDHRGFAWHFDLYVWVDGPSIHRGYGELIEVNGPDHRKQMPYSNGGYTKDQDKHWEVFSNYKMHKAGIEYRVVPNDLCKQAVVVGTAYEIAEELIERSLSWA